MYSSIPKNTYPTKHRSDDLPCFTGGYITTTADTDGSLDLPKSVYLTKGNSDEKTFSLRVDLPSKYIEIPLSISQLSEWFAKIGVEDAAELQYERESERESERAERDAEREAAIDMGEYDIGQEKGMLNWLNDDAKWAAQYDNAYCEENCEINSCTLTPSTYDHAGECVPSKEKCEYCYKYWCGKCGNGVSNYLVRCCQ